MDGWHHADEFGVDWRVRLLTWMIGWIRVTCTIGLTLRARSTPYLVR